jgi:hypothetical protein
MDVLPHLRWIASVMTSGDEWMDGWRGSPTGGDTVRGDECINLTMRGFRGQRGDKGRSCPGRKRDWD